MTLWIPIGCVLVMMGLLGILVYLLILLKIISCLTETNKQLLIVVAGKDQKPEALRALVALNKPPQGKLKGIATGKKKGNQPLNTNYTMEIGT